MVGGNRGTVAGVSATGFVVQRLAADTTPKKESNAPASALELLSHTHITTYINQNVSNIFYSIYKYINLTLTTTITQNIKHQLTQNIMEKKKFLIAPPKNASVGSELPHLTALFVISDLRVGRNISVYVYVEKGNTVIPNIFIIKKKKRPLRVGSIE